ncbi:MAG TPA: DUF3313 domain-containing protein [Bryobacteraceae bacterium]|nr:DUF3313 domain-containing protein [Bryobacteraceae bacterium]
MKRHTCIKKLIARSCVPLLLATLAGCAKKPEPVGLKKLAPNAENAGFLSSYTNLKPNPNFENTLSFVKQDETKNIHKYFAVIIEPVQMYLSTNADLTKMPDRGRTALAAYFQHAITQAVADAFPVVQEPGPLVLRLRTALVGVDLGAEIPTDQRGGPEAIERAIDIGKVGVEMELVDSVTGEQIAAAIDHQNLGSGATVGSQTFSRDEKFAAAKEAFDGWAHRLRDFLDSAEEPSAADARREDESYLPYGPAPKRK